MLEIVTRLGVHTGTTHRKRVKWTQVSGGRGCSPDTLPISKRPKQTPIAPVRAARSSSGSWNWSNLCIHFVVNSRDHCLSLRVAEASLKLSHRTISVFLAGPIKSELTTKVINLPLYGLLLSTHLIQHRPTKPLKKFSGQSNAGEFLTKHEDSTQFHHCL